MKSVAGTRDVPELSSAVTLHGSFQLSEGVSSDGSSSTTVYERSETLGFGEPYSSISNTFVGLNESMAAEILEKTWKKCSEADVTSIQQV